MTPLEVTLISSLTFFIGLLSGLLFKYADIISMKRDIVHIKEDIKVANVSELLTKVDIMSKSMLFDTAFQTKLSTVCSEHDQMRNQLAIDSNRLTIIETGINNTWERRKD